MTDQQTIWEWSSNGHEGTGTIRGTLRFADIPAAGQKSRRAQARRLHRYLEKRLGAVDLTITNNRRRMVTFNREDSRLRIRLHHMFLDGSDEVLDALVRFLKGDRTAEELIQLYVEKNRDVIEFEPEEQKLETVGTHFDLESCLAGAIEELEDYEFEGILITWGRDRQGNKSIQLGSYDFDQDLIRIHPALDQEWVPRYFVVYVIYHELIHVIVPPESNGDRREVHSDRFRQLERQFSRFEEAMSWESENLHRLLDRS